MSVLELFAKGKVLDMEESLPYKFSPTAVERLDPGSLWGWGATHFEDSLPQRVLRGSAASELSIISGMFRFRSLEDAVDSLQVVGPVILHFNKLSKV